MQQIERYGVIALVFLLVTIVAVSFWGDNKSPGFWASLTGRGGAKKTALADNSPGSSVLPPSSAAERALQNPLPLSPAPQAVQDDASARTLPFEPSVADPLASATPATSPSNGLVYAPTTTPTFEAPPAGPFPPDDVSLSLPQTSAQKPVAKAVAAPSSAAPLYVVQKGDSLTRIARARLGDAQRWTEIQALNSGVDPKNLRVGMKLRLPAGAQGDREAAQGGTKTRATAPVKASVKSNGATYVVKSGDSLTRIAERVLGDGQRWKDIVALNPGLDPKRLSVGKSLKMPAHESRALVAAALPSNSKNSEKPRVR